MSEQTFSGGEEIHLGCLGVVVFIWAGCWCLLLPGCEGASQGSHRWALPEGALDAPPQRPTLGMCPSGAWTDAFEQPLAQDIFPSYKKSCKQRAGVTFEWFFNSICDLILFFHQGVYWYERLGLAFARSALPTGSAFVCLSLTRECWWLQFFTIEITSTL